MTKTQKLLDQYIESLTLPEDADITKISHEFLMAMFNNDPFRVNSEIKKFQPRKKNHEKNIN